MAVEQKLLSHLCVIPLFKLDLDGKPTAAEMVLIDIKDKEEERLTYSLTR